MSRDRPGLPLVRTRGCRSCTGIFELMLSKTMWINTSTSSQAPSYASPKLRLTYLLTGVRCRATSVAKNWPYTHVYELTLIWTKEQWHSCILLLLCHLSRSWIRSIVAPLNSNCSSLYRQPSGNGAGERADFLRTMGLKCFMLFYIDLLHRADNNDNFYL